MSAAGVPTDSGDGDGDLSSADDVGSRVVFLTEPGACAGRLDPDQRLVPEPLASMVDFHVWPSASPSAVSARARTVCAHIDWALVAYQHPEWFERRVQVGVPALPDLWEAKRVLATFGRSLILEVQLENIEGELALAVYGAGVLGRLTDSEWHEVSALLTTCSSMISEPRADALDADGSLRLPARPPAPGGRRKISSRVSPTSWLVGDWFHTWWGFPYHGSLAEGCTCSAHTPAAVAVEFGPRPRVAD